MCTSSPLGGGNCLTEELLGKGRDKSNAGSRESVWVWGLRTLGHVCGAEEGMVSGDTGERISGWVLHTFWTLF